MFRRRWLDTWRRRTAAPVSSPPPLPPPRSPIAPTSSPAPSPVVVLPYAPRPAAAPVKQGALEQTIGLKWAGWIGAVVLVFGAVLGIKFAYDQGWLVYAPPLVRLIFLYCIGFALLGAGEWVYRRVNTIPRGRVLWRGRWLALRRQLVGQRGVPAGTLRARDGLCPDGPHDAGGRGRRDARQPRYHRHPLADRRQPRAHRPAYR